MKTKAELPGKSWMWASLAEGICAALFLAQQIGIAHDAAKRPADPADNNPVHESIKSGYTYSQPGVDAYTFFGGN